MRAIIHALLFFAVLTSGFSQENSSQSPEEIRLGKLFIQSNSLTDRERTQIAASIPHTVGSPDELAERVRQAARDMGYFMANVGQPTLLSAERRSGKPSPVDAVVVVDAGKRYTLGGISFQGNKVIPSEGLRKAFDIHSGDPFAPTPIGKGLEGLREQYGRKGYLNFVGTPEPKIDEVHQVISLLISLDEGNVYFLKDLLLEGVEPHAGAAAAMWKSWEPLRGKRYDPELLDRWLKANQSNCPGCTRTKSMSTMYVPPPPNAVNIRLTVPAAPDP